MVTFAPCGSYAKEDCQKALAEILDLSWVQPGMRIGIKANLVHAAKPE